MIGFDLVGFDLAIWMPSRPLWNGMPFVLFSFLGVVHRIWERLKQTLQREHDVMAFCVLF